MGGKLIEDFYKKHFNYYVKLFQKKYPKLNNVEDIIQETFIYLLKREVENINLPSLIYITINNRIKNHFVSNYYKINNVEIHDGLDLEKNTEVNHNIERLCKNYIELYMHYYEGFKYHEIAEILNMPINTVKTRIRTNKTKLKKDLKNYVHD